MALSPITRRRFYNFRANRRGYISFWIFLALLLVTLFAEFIANDKPIVLRYDGDLHFPIFFAYAETEFGGDFETEADYRDPFVAELIEEKGWMVCRSSPTATGPSTTTCRCRPRHHLRGTTGSAPTTRGGTCWPA